MLIFNVADQSTEVQLYKYMLSKMPEVFIKTIGDYSLTPEKIVWNLRGRCNTLRFSVMEEPGFIQCDSFETPEKDDVVSFLLQQTSVVQAMKHSIVSMKLWLQLAADSQHFIEGKFWTRNRNADILVFMTRSKKSLASTAALHLCKNICYFRIKRLSM